MFTASPRRFPDQVAGHWIVSTSINGGKHCLSFLRRSPENTMTVCHRVRAETGELSSPGAKTDINISQARKQSPCEFDGFIDEDVCILL